jgi:hypothetical protein
LLLRVATGTGNKSENEFLVASTLASYEKIKRLIRSRFPSGLLLFIFYL